MELTAKTVSRTTAIRRELLARTGDDGCLAAEARVPGQPPRQLLPAGAALGKEEYQRACAVCHRLATPFVGPSLGKNPLLTDAKGLATILRLGVGAMPAIGSGWSNDQIDALVAYTKTLTTKAGSGR